MNASPVSHVIPDETLVNWLFEAMNYESFIYTLSRYQQEVLYYKALDFEWVLWKQAEQEIPVEESDAGGWVQYGKIAEKLKAETYYENSQNLRKILGPLIKSTLPISTEADTKYAESDRDKKGDFSISIGLEFISPLYNILKLYFDETEHTQLLNRLSGKEDGNGKLLFLGDGNRLAFTFKQLYGRQIITRCSKAELEEWIFRNFRFKSDKSGGHTKEFTGKYLNELISTDMKDSKSPIIDILLEKGHLIITVAERKTRGSSN